MAWRPTVVVTLACPDIRPLSQLLGCTVSDSQVSAHITDKRKAMGTCAQGPLIEAGHAGCHYRTEPKLPFLSLS